MKFCTKCGNPHQDTAANCASCGHVFGRECRSCGRLVPAGSRFCPECGTPQTLAPTAELSDALTERREVTVVFVDAMNFTAASNRLDSEDVYMFIDEAMRLLVEVVRRYDGTIDKFTGDGLMALFGAPTAHEDDPERAVRAARDMQNVIGPLRRRTLDQYRFDFRIRIGIHTGPVVAGRVGSDLHAEYTVIGDTVNLASRLQSAADPDTILVSAATYRRTQARFNYQPLPPLTLKGMPTPVMAYQLIGGEDERSAAVAATEGPMFGREEELHRLTELLGHLGHADRCELVAITGEAGIGKSRLTRELTKIARERGRVIAGRASSLSSARPLWVIAELLRDLIGVHESDPSAVQAEALGSHLRRHELDPADLAPVLGNVLGVSDIVPELAARLRILEPRMLQEQTHAALRQILVAESSEGVPLVIVLENVQWIDAASAQFLQYLAGACSDQGLLLLLTCRQSEREVMRPVLETAQRGGISVTELDLRPLTAVDARRLADALIETAAEEADLLKARIVERSGGNPLYLEELVRMLVDRGGLVRTASGWSVAPAATHLLSDLPGTLRGLILTRFDFLPVVLRRTLQKAAVLGRSFPSELLLQISPADAPSMPDYLKELETRELLQAERRMGDDWYSFANTLLLEAVLSTLLKRDRQHLHERVADVIAEKGLWPFAERNEVLAYHYSESAAPAKALPYLTAAADDAARRHASEAAVYGYREALQLMRNLSMEGTEQFYRTKLGLAVALKFLGSYPEAAEALTSATTELRVAARENLSLLPLLISNLKELADLRVREGDLPAAAAYLHEATEVLQRSDRPGTEGLRRGIVERTAWVLFCEGKLDDAFAMASSAIRESDDAPEDATTTASIYNTLAGIYWQSGKPASAIPYIQKSIELYEQLGYASGTANAYTNLGVLQYGLGRWTEAAQNFDKSERIRNEAGYVSGRVANLNNLGLLRMSMGDFVAARANFSDSLRMSQMLGESANVVRSSLAMAQVATLEFKFDEAESHLDCAVLLKDSAGPDELIQIGWLRALASAERDMPNAISLAEDAKRLAIQSGLKDGECDASRVLGVLYTRWGKHGEAKANLQRAIDVAIETEDTYRHGLALLETANLAWRTGHESATELLSAAGGIFEKIGAAYDLKRADAISRAIAAAPLPSR